MIAPLIIPKKMLSLTDDDLLELCSSNDQLIIERNSEGELIIMSPVGGRTGSRNARSIGVLIFWNDKTESGYVFESSTGFALPDDSVLSPDASWIEKSRWEKLTSVQQEKFPPLCPDFVIELKPPSDSIKYLKEKMGTWIKNGCRLGWLIDPEKKEVTIYRTDGSVELKDFKENLSGENVLPGFTFDLAKLG